jgi:carbamoyltransferase
MNILGICGGVRLGNWDAAAALVQDGQLVGAAEEERFTRAKHAPGTLPTYAIRALLKRAKINIRDVDCVVFPGRTYVNMKARLQSYFQFAFGHAPRVELLDHHLCHAASVYRGSGFADALVITWDFSGDGLATTVREARGREMKVIEEYPSTQSLGKYYALITQHLGFDYGEDEYKVMGLSSYGKPSYELDDLLKVSDGFYELNPDMLRKTGGQQEPPLSPQEAIYSEEFTRRFGPPRLKDAPFDSTHQDFAASAQRHLEEAVLGMARRLGRKTGLRRLCIAGGVGMNAVANQRLAALPEFDEVFLPPVSGDAGLAAGAALEQANREGEKAPGLIYHAAWGIDYSDAEIAKSAKEIDADIKPVDDPATVAADLISRGKIVGWFQGRMEYGARALGHRSILADPKLEEMKDRVNAVVKFREGFRPFAPSAAEEHAGEYFEKIFYAPFMTFTFDVKPDMKAKIPAVTHVDGTARVQVVRQKVEPLYHKLISEVGRRTGVPMVLNTSFNIKGQPIVENPNQAISTYFGSGLQALVIGNFLLEKRPR